tara:strand:- start:55 stop:552 length:498 start_codon:yes stop_codon:yes gene_type:complete
MSIEKIEKLWRLATKNPNKNEAMVAARKFIEAVQRENVHVHISATEKPLSQQEIQQAVDKAYMKGIQDVKQQYQQELDRHLNTKYNEGYRDGQSNSYTKDDLDRYYCKGYQDGKNSNAIQKSKTSQITQKKYTSNDIFVNNTIGTLGTGTVTFHNGNNTIRIRRN